ncbi:PLDc N-terminal domain-containing protein [Candidatus Woesearchaeota archaeon]|nr:PLDc N-terminal domain-containing protein [Candidatus Woesearchaeota archaeon]
MSNYYIFEKSGDSWLLIDTDFHQKLGAGYVFKFIGNIFLIILPFLIIFGAFWLWMLIDCIKRQFEDKMMWILLIIFFSIIGAILYFFMMRKKLIQQEKMIGREKNVR